MSVTEKSVRCNHFRKLKIDLEFSHQTILIRIGIYGALAEPLASFRGGLGSSRVPKQNPLKQFYSSTEIIYTWQLMKVSFVRLAVLGALFGGWLLGALLRPLIFKFARRSRP